MRFDAAGLVPAIVQDPRTGRVLMVAYMSEQAIVETKNSGLVHLWSRSRRRLWKKGETSGNTLAIREMRPDCDGDALLVLAVPEGPTCHEGTATCFDDGPLGQGFASLEALWSTIESRLRTRPEGSYTASLTADGPDEAGRKVVEEATEVLMAAKDHANGTADNTRVAEEAADLVYHLLVLLAERGVAARDVIAVLDSRAR